jgi:hypothetical protein
MLPVPKAIMLIQSTTQSDLCIHTDITCINTACLQAVGTGVQSAQLMADRDRAVAALDEATKAAAAAQQDAARCAGKLVMTLALSVVPPCFYSLTGNAPDSIHECAR